MNTKIISEKYFFQTLFIDDIWTKLKSFMYPNKKTCCYRQYVDSDTAAYHGYLNLLMSKRNLKLTNKTIMYAAMGGHLNVIKYLHEKYLIKTHKKSKKWICNLKFFRCIRGIHHKAIHTTHLSDNVGINNNLFKWIRNKPDRKIIQKYINIGVIDHDTFNYLILMKLLITLYSTTK